jgi:hypothetical protein
VTSLIQTAQNFLIRDRSNYQLKHFVIEQHDTPEMQFRQILIEARSLFFRLKQAEYQVEITKLEIQQLNSSSNAIDQIEAKKRELDLAMSLSVLESARCELNYLIELSKNYPFFTADEIEDNQALYWQMRLKRQAETSQLSQSQNIDAGDIESLRQIGFWKKELE